jgi:hypothetical protein
MCACVKAREPAVLRPGRGPLLPLNVDGLILAASLVLLHEARNDRDAPGLVRLMQWLGISATIETSLGSQTLNCPRIPKTLNIRRSVLSGVKID